ncbi:MAG TPA: S8 family serine peptidase [Bacteroidales bacterium]|nr:S8 family serine peptidase [Bacteroidales bacterium]
MKNVLLLLALIIVGSIGWAQQPQTEHYLDPYNPEFVKGEIIIKFKDNVMVNIPKSGANNKTGVFSVDEELKDKSVISVGKVFRNSSRLKTRTLVKYPNGEEKKTPALYNIYRIKLDPGADIKALAEDLAEDPTVEFAEPNYLVYTMSTTPNDPLYPNQWHLGAVNAPQAWDSTTGDSTQVIGILDTGVDWDHPDLDDNIWHNPGEIPNNNADDDGNGYVDDVRGWDFVNDDNNPNDDNSHGTHVAGIAAAEGNNGTGVCGVAWNARIMPVKLLQSSGQGNSNDLAAAIAYAAENGATVINMSLGSFGESLTVKAALENAYSTAVLVAAAGNSRRCICYDCFPCANFYPAAYSFVIGVEASTPAGDRAGFSNYDPSGPISYNNPYGLNYEIMAPGTGVLSTFPNGTYSTLNGTSMAAPVVAGAVALMRQQDPAQSIEQIFARLLQSANNGVLDIIGALTCVLVPNLQYISYKIVDTLPGCDNDGIADAGETIELFLNVKNSGGWADSVWSKIRFAPYEDTTVATIRDSISYIGDISTYASLSGVLDPFRISINSSVKNNRDIVFEYEVGDGNQNAITGLLTINIQRGTEVSGAIIGNTVWTSDNLYIATANIGVPAGSKLTIKPGTIILLNPGITFTIDGQLVAKGTKDSLIYFTKNKNDRWGHLELRDSENNAVYNSNGMFLSGTLMEFVVVEYAGGLSAAFGGIVLRNSSPMIKSSIIRYNQGNNNGSGIAVRNGYYGGATVTNCMIYQNSRNGINSQATSKITHNTIFDNTERGVLYWKDNIVEYNNIIDNDFNIETVGQNYNSTYMAENCWFGTDDSILVSTSVYDYSDDFNRPLLDYSPYLLKPDSLSPPVVWKVLLNGQNPQVTTISPFTSEVVRFDVHFSKAMDISYPPLLSFGVREPYTQNIVSNNSSWSADSTVWTAFTTIDQGTGDGIQIVRVANAQDTDHFEIPVEQSRFEFVIQAAASASVAFMATPGIGKVDLEWPSAVTDDALGYNLYRYQFIDSVNTTDSIRINDALITDTVFTDFNVVPGETYYYFYTILGTDMAESDRSKIIYATPFSAANGDANGDMNVNVLDITTIVSYMLNQDPEPFLFDAADVNGDDNINVLDIIGVVQLISGSKSVPISKLIGWDQLDAMIFMDSTTIRLLSSGNIAALQFELLGENLEKINLYSNVEGFEFAYAVSEGKLIGILYSFKEKVIPKGLADLLSIELNGAVVDWGSITAGDLEGDYVKVNPQGNVSALNDDFYVSARPNPFNYTTSITYKLPEEAEVSLEIFNLHGQKVHSILSSQQPGGGYIVEWQGKDVTGQTVPAGIYFIMVNAKANVDQKVYSKCIKLIYSNQ